MSVSTLGVCLFVRADDHHHPFLNVFWKDWEMSTSLWLASVNRTPQWAPNMAVNSLPSQICSPFIVYQWWTADLALCSLLLRAELAAQLHTALIRLHTPCGACDQWPHSSLSVRRCFRPSFFFLSSSSLRAPSLSLCCSFALSSSPLSFYRSIHLSRSLGRPAQLTCLNSHLSIPSIPMWMCEREPVHWARSPMPGLHPQPSPATTSTSPPCLHQLSPPPTSSSSCSQWAWL